LSHAFSPLAHNLKKSISIDYVQDTLFLRAYDDPQPFSGEMTKFLVILIVLLQSFRFSEIFFILWHIVKNLFKYASFKEFISISQFASTTYYRNLLPCVSDTPFRIHISHGV
jgi:hypothetical protein